MIGRLKTALVESFVGTILAAWLFAEGLIHAVGIITSPLMSWATMSWERAIFAPSVITNRPSQKNFPWDTALPEAISALLLLLIACGILRWLYYKQPEPQEQEPTLD